MKKLTIFCISAALVGATLRVHADSGRAQASTAAPAIVSGDTGVVLKDKVNVRARADKNSEVVDHLVKGNKVTIVEQKTDWLRIKLRPAAKCYVSAKLVKNAASTADGVNVRCGQGINFKDVGKLAKGEKVELVGTAKGEWVQIKPTAHCTGWVSASLIEVAAPPVAPPVIAKAPEPVVTPPVVAPAPPMPIATPEPVAVPGPINVPMPKSSPINVADTSSDTHSEFVVKDGIFQPVLEPGAPAKYELTTIPVERREYRLAFLEISGTDLTKYEGKHVRIIGTMHWKKTDRYPVITVERIDMVW